MVMVLERSMVKEIERIGKLRLPTEACGILLPIRWRNQQVWELPNRSKTPHDSFEMLGEDIGVLLEDFIEEFDDPAIWDEIVVWHTHPNGNLGPSSYDLQNKPTKVKSLVVTLYDDAEAKPTWF